MGKIVISKTLRQLWAWVAKVDEGEVTVIRMMEEMAAIIRVVEEMVGTEGVRLVKFPVAVEALEDMLVLVEKEVLEVSLLEPAGQEVLLLEAAAVGSSASPPPSPEEV
jgi:redox-sensitive bicupin YhaK (pirin superfamily)